MADENDGPPRARDVAHFAEALFLEIDVADGEHFIDEQNFRLEMRGHGKRQPHVHPARIMFHRRIDEFFQLRERHNLIELALDLLLVHPQDRAAQERVFPARQLRMKSGAHFEQRPDAPVNLRPARGRLRNPRKDFQQRGLARAVPPDQAKHFPFIHLQETRLSAPRTSRPSRAGTPPAATSRTSPAHAAARDQPPARAGTAFQAPLRE